MYTPKNSAIFSSAFSGALSGALSGRMILSANAPSYDDVNKAAGAFAQEFDTQMDGIVPTNTMLQLIEEVTSNVFSGRAIHSLTATDYANICAAIIASLTSSENWFANNTSSFDQDYLTTKNLDLLPVDPSAINKPDSGNTLITDSTRENAVSSIGSNGVINRMAVASADGGDLIGNSILQSALLYRDAKAATSLTVVADPAFQLVQDMSTLWGQLAANWASFVAASDPLGGNAAWTITDKVDAAPQSHVLYKVCTNVTIGNSYRFKFWFKKTASLGMLQIKADNGAARMYVKPSDGSVFFDPGANSNIRGWTEDSGDGGIWSYLEFVATTGGAVYIGFSTTSTGGAGTGPDFANNVTYQGDGTRSCTIFIPPNDAGFTQLGQAVSAQTDARSNVALATQVTASARPMRQLTKAWPDGAPVIALDGLNRTFTAHDRAVYFSGMGQPFTFMWLADIQSVPTSDATIVSLANSNGSGLFKLVLASANAIKVVRTTDTNVSTTVTFNGKIPLQHAVWALVYDGINVRLFIDGVEDAGGAKTLGSASTTFDRLTFFGQYLVAKERSCPMLNRALSAYEVKQASATLARQNGTTIDPWNIILLYGQSNAVNYQCDGQGTNKLQDPRVRLYYDCYTTQQYSGSWQALNVFGSYFLGAESGLAWRAIQKNKRLGIIKTARNGTPLAGDGQGHLRWMKSDNEMYATAATDRANALSLFGSPIGKINLVYIGCENDCIDIGFAGAIAPNASTFIQSLRTDLNYSQMCAAWHRINANLSIAAGYTYRDIGIASENSINNGGPVIDRFRLFNGDDLTLGSDSTHYTAGSEFILGQRAWDTLEALGAFS